MKTKISLGVKSFFLFLFISTSQTIFSQEEIRTIDVRALSLGQVKALSQGPLNPAYLSFSKQPQLSVSVFSRFEMKELSTKSIFGSLPNPLIDASIAFSAFGYEDYQLLQGQIGLAKKLSPALSIGAAFSCFSENSILEERTQNYLFADIGLFWKINDSFDWALITENLLHTRNPQRSFCFTGINYRLLSDACLLLEAGYDFQKQLNLSAGFEYEIVEQFAVRGGFRNNPQTPSLGLAYRNNHWKAETVFLLHSTLGLSSGIGITYTF